MGYRGEMLKGVDANREAQVAAFREMQEGSRNIGRGSPVVVDRGMDESEHFAGWVMESRRGLVDSLLVLPISEPNRRDRYRHICADQARRPTARELAGYGLDKAPRPRKT